MKAKKQFEEVFQSQGYRFFTRLQADMLTIKVAPQCSDLRQYYLYSYVSKNSGNEKESWNLQDLRDHIKESKNVQIDQSEMSLSIKMKKKLFGKTLNLQILKIKLLPNLSEEQDVKMQRLPKSNIKQELSNQTIKKAIIVVGRMGHGKSSFVNSLIAPRGNQIPEELQRRMLITGADTKSITTECQFVESNQSHKFLEQPLYAIDTPGLNSDDAICLVSEQIDNIIIEKRCQIVGIAYVINLGADRQIAGNDTSTLKQFMKLLKMKKQIKNSLLFFILTNWDNLCSKWKAPQIQKCLNGFIQLVKQVGINDCESTMIKWANPFCGDQEFYQFFLERKGGKQIVSQQWKKLRDIIRKCSKKPLKLLQHVQNINKFWLKLMQQIFSQIQDNNLIYKKDKDIINFQIQLNIQQASSKTGQKLKRVGITAALGAAQMALGVLTLQSGVGLVPLLSGGLDVLSSVAALPIIGIMHLFRRKQKLKQQVSKIQNPEQGYNQIMKQKMIKQITLKITSMMRQIIKNNIIISDDKITFQPIKGLKKSDKLQFFYNYGQQSIRLAKIMSSEFDQRHSISIELKSSQPTQDQLDFMISENYRTGHKKHRIPEKSQIYIKKDTNKLAIRFQLTCRLPKQQNYYKMIRQQSQNMFGKYD